MKQNWSLVLLVILCAACSKKVAPSVTTEVRDSIIVKEVPRFIEVKVPGDKVEVVKWIECDSNKIKPVAIKKKSGKATLLVTIDKKGILTATAICDSLMQVIETKDKEITQLRSTTRKETIIDVQYKTRFIDKVCRWIAGVVVLTGGAFVAKKFLI